MIANNPPAKGEHIKGLAPVGQPNAKSDVEMLLEEVSSMLAPAFQDEAVYEGNIKVQLEPPGSIKTAVEFIKDLRNTPQLRLLRLDSKPGYGADILIGLREPFRLKNALHSMRGVGHVDDIGPRPAPGALRVLKVRLAS